ncbi:unnamed protein product, partial [Didymodactylos carnosus]
VNRPMSMKKENIQTRNRKPNSKRKDKDQFPYLLMKSEPLGSYHHHHHHHHSHSTTPYSSSAAMSALNSLRPFAAAAAAAANFSTSSFISPSKQYLTNDNYLSNNPYLRNTSFLGT